MATQMAATKGNLIATKKSLSLAETGFELLDRKRNILVREMMMLITKASTIQDEIAETYSKAYATLQKANITVGICGEIAKTVKEENGVSLSYKSVMGVEIPILAIAEKKENSPPFGMISSNETLDEAYKSFEEVKRLTIELAEVENSAYRLADSIKKTQKRANALKNVIIPKLSEDIKSISVALEEKSREEFSRMKVIKKQKLSNDV